MRWGPLHPKPSKPKQNNKPPNNPPPKTKLSLAYSQLYQIHNEWAKKPLNTQKQNHTPTPHNQPKQTEHETKHLNKKHFFACRNKTHQFWQSFNLHPISGIAVFCWKHSRNYGFSWTHLLCITNSQQHFRDTFPKDPFCPKIVGVPLCLLKPIL